MKDLSTYAVCFVAVLTAAIAVAGLLASTADPAAPSEPQAVVVDADDTRVATTMHIPF